MNYLHTTNIDFSALATEFFFVLFCAVVAIVALIFVIAGLLEWWQIIKESLGSNRTDSHEQ